MTAAAVISEVGLVPEAIDSAISDCIDRLGNDFLQCPNRILTEDDMRIHLGSLLLGHFGACQRTEDGDESIALHSEVRWYGNGRLKYRSDLVVIAVRTLRVLNAGVLSLPSKGYAFNVPDGIIELKLRRPNGVGDSAFVNSIEADLLRLERIRAELSDVAPRLACWVVAFDKKGDIGGRVPARDGETVVYRSSHSTSPQNGRPDMAAGREPRLSR